MATFFMFGKYSAESLKEISPKRTDKAVKLFKKFGGEIKSSYALLGKKDLVFIVDMPDTEQVMKVSVALAKMSGISFISVPAVTVEEFDKMMADV